MQSGEHAMRLGHTQSYLVAVSSDDGGDEGQEENQAQSPRAAYAAARGSAIPWLPPCSPFDKVAGRKQLRYQVEIEIRERDIERSLLSAHQRIP